MKLTHKIGIIGLGYVGLPLAVEFSKKYEVIGFDISLSRIEELRDGIDSTLEIETFMLEEASNLTFTSDINEIKDCNIYIITVPTPIDENKEPNLRPLENASSTVGKVLKKGDIVIYESTVFPGATEEVCVPILENISGLKYLSGLEINSADSNLLKNAKGFYCGYSPERINPGDKKHRLTDIVKVTSGSTPEIAIVIDNLYSEIITAGTHKTSSIKIAEAAKVIENTQRDVNIALINELSLIFNKLNLDTNAILEAAETKWNFLSFKPGLVGGHCIGIDPYYLTYKALEVGHKPEIILAGRKINNAMGQFVAEKVIQLMTLKNIQINGSNILIMGLTFKENCPDIRNTRVIDLIKNFERYNCKVEVYDPWVDKKESLFELNLKPINYPADKKYDAIVIAVAHNEFKEISISKLKTFAKSNNVLFDVKNIYKSSEIDGSL